MASRQKKIVKFYKKLVKRYPDDPVVLSRDRKILEHLVFAIFLENASFDVAREFFLEIERYFVDWNEIRVSLASEIADVVPRVPDAVRVGERLRRLLQWIFDTTYKFDLEDMRAKGRDEVINFLKTVPFSTPFMNDYAALFGFGDAVVPLDEGSLRVLRLLDLVAVSADRREIVPELEGEFDEKERLEFFFALHELGAELSNETKRDGALKFLRAFDPKIDERSDAPLVEPSLPIDPREIARLFAKQEKRPKRVAPPFDDPDLLDDGDGVDDLDASDDLAEKSESANDFDDNYEAVLDENDVDFPRRSAKKLRSRKNLFEIEANEETSLTKDVADYSDFSAFAEENSRLEVGDDHASAKKTSGKSKKKLRNVDESSENRTPQDDASDNFADENVSQNVAKNDVSRDEFPRNCDDDFENAVSFDGSDENNGKTKNKKRTRAKDDDSICVDDERNKKKESKKSDSLKKTSPKKEAKSEPPSVDEPDSEAEPETKSKQKSKAAKNSSDNVDSDAKGTKKASFKTNPLQQKKPR